MANVTVTLVPPVSHPICINLDSDDEDDHDENLQPGAKNVTLTTNVDKFGIRDGNSKFQNRLKSTDNISVNEKKKPFEIGVVWKIPIRWKCGFCTSTAALAERSEVEVPSYSSLPHFTSHLNRFCHFCDSEFSSKEVRNRHFEIRHRTLSNSKLPGHSIFKCEGCRFELMSFKDFENHALTCEHIINDKTQKMSVSDRLKCFSCGVATGSSVKDLYSHFENCSLVHISDARRANLSVEEVIKYIKNEGETFKDVLQNNNDVRLEDSCIVKTTSSINFPRTVNLKRKRQYLDNDIEYLKAILTPRKCRVVLDDKRILDRTIRMAKKSYFQITEVSLPDVDPIESGSLPGGASPSDVDSDTQRERLFLLGALPEADLHPNEPVERPLFGAMENGWQVLPPPSSSRQQPASIPVVINIDGACDLSESETNLFNQLSDESDGDTTEACCILGDCVEVSAQPDAPSPKLRPFVGFTAFCDPSATLRPIFTPKNNPLPISNESWITRSSPGPSQVQIKCEYASPEQSLEFAPLFISDYVGCDDDMLVYGASEAHCDPIDHVLNVDGGCDVSDSDDEKESSSENRAQEMFYKNIPNRKHDNEHSPNFQAQSKKPTCMVKVTSIPPELEHQLLLGKYFSRFGMVLDCRLNTDESSALIKFSKVEDAIKSASSTHQLLDDLVVGTVRVVEVDINQCVDEKEEDESKKSEYRQTKPEGEFDLHSATELEGAWKNACPRVYARLSTFDESVVEQFPLKNNAFYDECSDSDSDDADWFDFYLAQDDGDPEPLILLGSCRSDLEDDDISLEEMSDVIGTLSGEWTYKSPADKIPVSIDVSAKVVSAEAEEEQKLCMTNDQEIVYSISTVNCQPTLPSTSLVSCQKMLQSFPVENSPFLCKEKINPILSVDGACDFSDSDDDEKNDVDYPGPSTLEDNSDTADEESENEGMLLPNSVSEEVFVKQEDGDDIDDEDFNDFDPIEHLEVGMPQTFSVMSNHASGINRIQKTNAPQTPQKCNDCSDEDKWFNTRDALLAHDVFYHQKKYCAPCDIFFLGSDELESHRADLHLRFTCDQCGVCVEGKDNFTRHYLECHRILHCLLCSYSFTVENVEVHMTQGHRIPEWDESSCPRMMSDDFGIIFDETKLTAKCNLCFKKFTREKIYNHLRYFHHSSTHQVVGLLQAANFNLAPGGSNQLQDVVSQELKTSDIHPNPVFIDFEGRSGFCLIPQSTKYNCPIANCPDKGDEKQDAGLHLLLDHSMSFCFICGGFFVERRQLARHYELSHPADEKNTCFLCPGKPESFVDHFSLTVHLHDFHFNYLCCFCDNMPFDTPSDLMTHVQQYHEMWQNQDDGMADNFYDRLLNSTLARWDKENRRMECQMCSTNIDNSDLSDSENFRRHLSKFHSIRYLEKFMAMFESVRGTFVIRSLDFRGKNVVTETPTMTTSQDPFVTEENGVRKATKRNSVQKRKVGVTESRNSDSDEDDDENAFLSTKKSKNKSPTKKSKSIRPASIVEVKLEVDDDEDASIEANEEKSNLSEVLDNNGDAIGGNEDAFDDSEDGDDAEAGSSNNPTEGIHCELCSTTTQSKQSMRRHCLQSHDLPSGYFRKDICHSCNHCDAMFWSVADKVQHIAQAHSAIQDSLEKCFVCFHVSPNKHALRRHFKRMHPEEKLFENVSYKCPFCGDLFELQRKMYDHIKDEHPDHSSHPCRLCDKKFSKVSSWKKHQEFHKQESLQHTCTNCGTTFETKKKFTWHVKNCQDSKKEPKLNFKCKLCEQKFADRDEREIHYKQAHPNEPMYPCGECGAKFNTKSARWSHSFSHKADDTFKCEHCEKTFNRRDTFREHLLIHTGPRYRCTHCPKEFVQRSNLRRHIRIHLGIKPYNCNFCNLTFSDKGACNSHMKIHTGDNKATCTYCGQEFSKGQKLRYHMRLHTGEGLLTCDLCQKVFTNSYSLKTHLKRVHAKIQDKFPCYFCERPGGYEATNRKSLKSHIDRVHPTASKQCRVCLIESSSAIEVNMHMMNVHFPEDSGTGQVEDGGYQCRHCESKFPGLSDIKRHLTEDHEVKSGFSMHYLNRYINEANFPTLSGGDAHTQLSVVLVSEEPPPNSKARRKEEALRKKEQKQREKKEQEKIKQQQKLEKQQLKMAKQETAPKIKVKVRKPANPKKLVLNSPDVEDSLSLEAAPTIKTEDEDERHVSNEFLARMKANLEQRRHAEQEAGASGGYQFNTPQFPASNLPHFDPRKFLEIQRNLQAANALQSFAAVGGFFKSEENDSDEQVQHIKVEPDIH